MSHFSDPGDFEAMRQREIRKRLEESGWFERGLDMLTRLETAGFRREELCWFLPTGALGPGLLIGAELTGLKVQEGQPGSEPGVGIALPVCTRQAKCPAHTEPPREVDHLWKRWAGQHRVLG